MVSLGTRCQRRSHPPQSFLRSWHKVTPSSPCPAQVWQGQSWSRAPTGQQDISIPHPTMEEEQGTTWSHHKQSSLGMSIIPAHPQPWSLPGSLPAPSTKHREPWQLACKPNWVSKRNSNWGIQSVSIAKKMTKLLAWKLIEKLKFFVVYLCA